MVIGMEGGDRHAGVDVLRHGKGVGGWVYGMKVKRLSGMSSEEDKRIFTSFGQPTR